MGSQISENLDVQEPRFRHYSLKHRIVATLSRFLFDGVVYRQRHGLITGMKRKGGLGWMPAWTSHDTPELTFWRSLATTLSGKVVYDIGAFQGLLTLYFARHARQVIAYEPSQQTRARLETNLRLNNVQNVTVRPIGIGDREAELTLVADPTMPGGASLDRAIQSGMAGNVRSETIRISTLDADVQRSGLPAPDLVKIDIEGYEVQALLGAAETIMRHKPSLYVEVHGETMHAKTVNARRMLSILREYGYSEVLHIETGNRLDLSGLRAGEPAAESQAAIAARGHLYTRS